MERIRFIVIGSGWRSLFYVRIAQRYPELFELCAMLCRTQAKADAMRAIHGIPTTTRAEDCAAMRPDFAVIALSQGEPMLQACEAWARRGIPILAETPFPGSEAELKAFWERIRAGELRIQIAEQYHRYPMLAAGLAAVAAGRLGEPSVAVLSAVHDYHAFSLMRRMLAIRPQPVRISGKRYAFPVVETDSRGGPITDGTVLTRDRVLLKLEFEAGKVGIYDFSSVQYHTFIRARHINVRGERGEWNDATLRHVAEQSGRVLPMEERLAPLFPAKYAPLMTGALEAYASPESRQSELPFATWEDEYAIATMLYDMQAYLCTGEEVYPNREALDDAYLTLLAQKALEHPGEEIASEPMPWQV